MMPCENESANEAFWEGILAVQETKREIHNYPKLFRLLGCPEHEFTTEWAANRCGKTWKCTYAALYKLQEQGFVRRRRRGKYNHEWKYPTSEAVWQIDYGAWRERRKPN